MKRGYRLRLDKGMSSVRAKLERIGRRRAIWLATGTVCLTGLTAVFQNCGFTTSSVDEFEIPLAVEEALTTPSESTESRGSSELPDFGQSVELVRPKARIAMARSTTCVSPKTRLYCFGDNATGQGASSEGALLKSVADANLFNDPTFLSADQTLESAAGGDSHFCARMNTGRLICWGANDQAQLGRTEAGVHDPGYVDVSSLGDSFAPVDVVSGAGMSFTLSQGQVYCWGACGGFTSSDSASAPTLLTAEFPESVVTLSVRKDSANPRLCAILQSSKAMCLEPGGEPQYVMSPQAADQPAQGIRQAVLGADFECFLVQDAVLCRGSNAQGALGTGDGQVSSDSLALVDGLGRGAKVKQLATGGRTTCALTEDQVVYCWGSNAYGALGTGDDCAEGDTGCYSARPQVLKFSDKFKDRQLAIREIAGTEAQNADQVSGARFCVLFEDSSLACWGQRYLGDGEEVYGTRARGYSNHLRSALFPGSTDRPIGGSETSEEFQTRGGPATETVRRPDTLPSQTGNSSPVTFERRITRTQKMTCAFPDINMYCWGLEGQGLLGGSETKKGLKTVVPTYAELLNDSAHLNTSQTYKGVFNLTDGTMCALMSNGKVLCWNADKMEYKTPFGSGSGQVKAADMLAKSPSFWVMLLNGGIKYWNGSSASTEWVSGFLDSASVKVTAIATQPGASKVCARLEDGTAKCFAGSSGTSERVKNPTDTSRNLDGIRQVAVGLSHQCFLVGDAVACAGKNDKGQLGNGSTRDSLTVPVVVQDLGAGSNVKLIAANGNTSCAVKTSNEVVCWGSNQDGALGTGTAPNCAGANAAAPSCYSAAPVRVTTTDRFPTDITIEEIEILGNAAATDVTGNYRQVCLRLSNKGIACWGGRTVGNETDQASSRPSPVKFGTPSNGVPTSDSAPTPSPSSSEAFAAGQGANDSELSSAPTASTVPRGGGGGGTPPPLPVSSRILINNVSRMTGDATHVCVFPDKRMFCWGVSGGYRNGTEIYKSQPLTRPVPADLLNSPEHLKDSQYFAQLAEGPGGGGAHCVLMTNGKVRCWSHNEIYYLTSYWSSIPARIEQISGTFYTTYMSLLVDGGVMRGEVGNDDYARRRNAPPAFLSGMPRGGDAVALSRGYCRGYWPIVIMRDSSAKIVTSEAGSNPVWTTIKDPENTSVALTGIRAAVQMSDTDKSYCLLVHDGVLCGGANNYGQLGDGTTVDPPSYPVPVLVRGLTSGVKLLAAGGRTACAVKTDDSVYCWGGNTAGMLGIGVEGNDCNGDNANTLGCRSPAPRLVSGTDQIRGAGRSITQIEVGFRTVCVLLDDKSMSCWGNYPGNGTTVSNVPVPVEFPH